MNNFGILFAIVTFAVICITNSAANAIDRDYRPAGLEIEDPDYVMDLINKLGRSIIRQNEYQDIVRNPSMTMKRGLDLGLNRGFSGSQAAKHLMGLAAANFAGGPGRRRRSVDKENHFNSASSKAYDSPAEDRQLEKIWR